ncbi:nuclease [Virgisporangium aliadipatigenens]|uniref:Nuclease n=1 Tax=Virgisporangium aliadipatigenens TaxID=741659 RepID=A0A8J4DSZ3_9ACTN|nr:SbcC/MukB-like Walker B domain-containing protein [Virgisporangium aliadipatigenens]GIJ48388.1 nuclease [Virgisporangium aliadipatigenens]
MSERTLRLGQFRLTRLQVVNWGAFCGYKDVAVDERGLLLTGRSGSGKSSLMDAHSTVLLPTTDQRFNASADLTARGAKQSTRSVADYVRGAWSENRDENDQAHVRYLRGGKPTWSAIGATYDNGLGSVTTAVVVKWFAGTETDGASLKSMYQLHDGQFSVQLLEEWAARRFDSRWFKATYPAEYPVTQAAYLRDLARRVGLGASRTAVSLLGKAKALKNVGDLNMFIRDNMLDRPVTFDAAARMVAAFTPLNEAYETAERAHRQERVLKDVPGLWKRFSESRESTDRARSLLGEPAETYLRGVRLRAVEAEIERIDRRLEALDETLGAHNDLRDRAFAAYTALEAQWRQDARHLHDLEMQHRLATAEHGPVQAAYRAFSAIVTRLRRPVPTDLASFSALREALPAIRAEALSAEASLRADGHAVLDAMADARRAHKEKRAELTALQSARTLIPARDQARRQAIADGAGIAVADLPYAAELIDIADDEERWRPAAERVLRGFGLRLLVPRKHADAVRNYIDHHRIKGVVDYSVVGSTADPSRAVDGTLAAKLVVDDTHPFSEWLRAELARRFDHACVENAEELDRHRIGVTLRGTVKLPGNHYRKDDRDETANPANYILGADTGTKRDALQSEVDALHRAEREATAAADNHQSRLRAAQESLAAAGELDAYPSWAAIDRWASGGRIRELDERIAAVRTDNRNLLDLEQQRVDAERRYKDAEEACAATRNEIRQLTDRMPVLVDLQKELGDQLHRLADDGDRVFLDDVLAATGVPVSPDTFALVENALRRELVARRDAADSERRVAQTRLEAAMRAFIEQWRDAAPDTSADAERSGADFAALYEDIAERRLPEAMNRFQQMIAEDMVPSISVLQREIENASTEIRKRVAMVNEGLTRVEFNTGTRLQIAHRSVASSSSSSSSASSASGSSDDARSFRAAVDALLRHAPNARRDAEASRAQFKRVRALMARFTADTAEARQWRENVLDVRNSFTFYGREELIADGSTVATFSNTSANSGGEQEKLVAFCLAAALSYNLADGDGVPAFAPLMLDEAFSKSDETFAAQALGVFHEFGFQLLIAAPIRMAGIVEPFIGQAVLVDKRVLPDGPRSAAASATFGELATRAAA